MFVLERFKFYSAKQEENEDVKSFVARLKSLILHCDFKEFLQQALRDQLVCGLRSEGIKRKLLTEENLTFERAVQITVSMEIAEGQRLKVMRTETSTVNKINMQKGSKHKKLSRGGGHHWAKQISIKIETVISLVAIHSLEGKLVRDVREYTQKTSIVQPSIGNVIPVIRRGI